MLALFRCDASPRLGVGHLMRCLAFAETLSFAGWRCTFATRPDTLDTVPALRYSGHELRVIEQDSNVDIFATLAVVDHYCLDAAFERSFGGDTRVVVFDDLADRAHDCAVLVDPTPGRDPHDYRSRVNESCRLLLGPKHAILRSEWQALRVAACARLAGNDAVRRIFVSMGGTDPDNSTAKVIAAIASSRLDIPVDVVLGAGAPHIEKVKKELSSNMTLHIEPQNLAGLCAWADLAIGAAGTSSFERAVLGLPTILVQLADNQRFIINGFGKAGAAEILPFDMLNDSAAFGSRIASLVQDRDRRRAMSQNAAAITDGRGGQRLLLAIAGEARNRAGRIIRLRLAEPEDEDWLLELQRQEPTRQYALNPAVPTVREHAQWFARVLGDMRRVLAIVEVDGLPVGMLRLDRIAASRTSFEISIAIDSARHGEGIGTAALALARRLAPGADLVATVKPENEPSLALFAAAGYRPEGNNRYCSRAA